MSKKNSLIFQITVLFSVMFLLINVIIYVQFLFDDHNSKMISIKRYMTGTKIIFDSKFENLTKEEINKKLEPLYLEIAVINLKVLKKSATKIIKDEYEPLIVFILNTKKYIYLSPPSFKPKNKKLIFNERERFPKPFNHSMKQNSFEKSEEIILVDKIDDNNIKYLWLLILLVIDVLLAWFYLFLYKKLKPLIKLKKEITKFSKGDLDINTKVNGKDEIAEVSNEFNNAIKKIKELNDSRKLFLRNILHELKTPITKGKLISDTLENCRKKEILQKAFLRLEYLLEEFVTLEELSSGKMDLIKKEYRIIDLLDQSIDILLIDRSKIKIYSNFTKVNVDFEIFSIAIKNLIDNAIKYSTNGKVEILVREDSLLIKNKGNPLKKEFEHYLKPFSREYESIDKGLGLGLYITNNVVKIHGFRLCYLYEDDYHILSIKFKSEP